MAAHAQELENLFFVEVARPSLRLVETVPPPKAMPPAWMIAPAFRTDPALAVREQQAPFQSAAAGLNAGPYRSIREVPRAG